MATSHVKKAGTTGKRKNPVVTSAKKTHRAKGSAALPPGVKVRKYSSSFLVSKAAAPGAEVQGGWATTRKRSPGGAATRQETKNSVAHEAYEAGARAKAILRGVTYAEKDLKAAGGTYDVDEVRTLFRGVSRQAVDKKVAEGSLLAVPGPSGRRRFPAAQFSDDGTVVRGLKEVQSALAFSSQWSVLNFLVNDHDLLGNEKPIEALRRGEIGRVVEVAKRSGVHGG